VTVSLLNNSTSDPQLLQAN